MKVSLNRERKSIIGERICFFFFVKYKFIEFISNRSKTDRFFRNFAINQQIVDNLKILVFSTGHFKDR